MIASNDENKIEEKSREPEVTEARSPEQLAAEIIQSQSRAIVKLREERESFRTQLDIQHDLVANRQKIIDDKQKIIETTTPILERCYNYIAWLSAPTTDGNKFTQAERETELMNMLGYLKDNGYEVDMPKSIRRAAKEPENIPDNPREVCPFIKGKCMQEQCAIWREDTGSCPFWEIPDAIGHLSDKMEGLLMEIARGKNSWS